MAKHETKRSFHAENISSIRDYRFGPKIPSIACDYSISFDSHDSPQSAHQSIN